MKKIGIALFALSMPMVVLADGELADINNLVTAFGNIINIVIPIVFALIVIAFFWGLAKYVMSAGDESKKAEGRNLMIGGVIALFVAAAIWGIVEFIGTQLGIDTDTGVAEFGGPTTDLDDL